MNNKEQLLQQIEQLASPSIALSCKAMRILEEKSRQSDEVYGCVDRLIEMLNDRNFYAETRAFLLIAENSRWDRDGKIEAAVDKLMEHIASDRGTTARQCIQALPLIAQNIPGAARTIAEGLKELNISRYKASMQQIIKNDIEAALEAIENTDK